MCRLEEEQRKKQELEELALQEEKERKRRDKLQRNTGKLSFAAGVSTGHTYTRTYAYAHIASPLPSALPPSVTLYRSVLRALSLWTIQYV